MLAYRHLFHAGNFADVFKHALLTRLLLALTRKDKPLCYIDTHAGTGLYDLTHPWARKNAEYRDGIERVWTRRDAPAALAPYLAAVRAANPGGRLRAYPGSPRIACELLRPADRAVLCELNKDDCAQLKALFASDARVGVHQLDGYLALKAFLPPPERRGLVLVDSSFDQAGEFTRLVEGLGIGHARWDTGTFALWYPLMEPPVMHAFERRVIATGIRKILQLEFAVLPDRWTASLRGSGLLVVNPAFGFEHEARPLLEWLWGALAPEGEGGVRVRWLVPE
jgi:23S rRNA (adenine2030-N6)-methyltransferase